jgi:hypothetical protein
MAPQRLDGLFALFLLAGVVVADGPGLIGWGKHMYNPTCAFACRSVVSASPLACTPQDSGSGGGGHHHSSPTPPECFVTDRAYLRTMAVCIDTYCPTSDNPPLSLIQDYWDSHLATGSIGNYKWRPVISYAIALDEGRRDEAQGVTPLPDESSSHGDHSVVLKSRALPLLIRGDPLNVTSSVAEEDWRLYFNGSSSFEINENRHTVNTCVVAS